MRLIVVIVAALLCVGAAHASMSGNTPSWEERTMTVWTNVVRGAPQQFHQEYLADVPGIMRAENHPAVPPVYWNADLGRAAVAHGQDMAQNGCFSHESCDGTAWDVRVESFYSKSQTISENIAVGQKTPLDAVKFLVKDFGHPDLSAGAAHRTVIMRHKYGEVGCGLFRWENSKYKRYWVQDYGGADGRAAASGNPIAAATHDSLSHGEVLFLANYADDNAPESISVVVGGQKMPMQLRYGQHKQGTYQAELAAPARCAGYYFEAVDAEGMQWRYPETGGFATYGVNGCSLNIDTTVVNAPGEPVATPLPPAPVATPVPTPLPTPVPPAPPAPETEEEALEEAGAAEEVEAGEDDGAVVEETVEETADGEAVDETVEDGAEVEGEAEAAEAEAEAETTPAHPAFYDNDPQCTEDALVDVYRTVHMHLLTTEGFSKQLISYLVHKGWCPSLTRFLYEYLEHTGLYGH